MKVVTHLRFKHKKIILENIQLYPSDVYSATISGVFDVDKTVNLSDTVTDGSVFGYSKINSKTININIFIKNHDDIRSHLAINGLLTKKNLKLYVEYDYLGLLENNITITSKSTSDEFDGVISIVATAYDPYFRTEAENLYLGVVYGNGLTFPTQLPFTFNGSMTGDVGKVTNLGYVDAYPVITIEGACENFSLMNETTGQVNFFPYVLNTGDVLVMDCRPNSLGVTLNGVKQDNRNFTFYYCPSGDNIWKFNRNQPAESVKNCKISLESRIL